MGNSFASLKGLAADLRVKAREKEEQEIKQAQVQAKIARDTKDFLDTMRRTGVKAAAGVKLAKHTQDDDIDFAQAMRKAGVEPLNQAPRVQHKRKVAPIPRQTMADKQSVLRESLSDEHDSIEFLESEDGLAFRRPGIGPDVPRDLRRGRWTIVGQIDLHGMFVEEARGAVVEFLKRAQQTERLCVRIIHGKGHGSPDRQSILREMVRRWLKQRDEVIAYAEPKEHDGGAGATIVRLKPLKRP